MAAASGDRPVNHRLAALSRSLTAVLGERLIAGEAGRARFMAAEGHHPPALPDLVAQPRSVAEVQAVMAAAGAQPGQDLPEADNTPTSR